MLLFPSKGKECELSLVRVGGHSTKGTYLLFASAHALGWAVALCVPMPEVAVKKPPLPTIWHVRTKGDSGTWDKIQSQRKSPSRAEGGGTREVALPTSKDKGSSVLPSLNLSRF